MSSHWSLVTRIVTSLECFLILLVHGFFLLLVIMKTKMSRSFRIVLFINATHGILFGLVILLVLSAHVFHNGHFAVPLFGPLLPLLPKFVQDSSMVSLTVLCYMIWQLIPAPVITQYLALTRPHWSVLLRFSLSYLITVLYVLYDMYFVITLVPTPEYEKVLISVSREAFDLDPNEQFVVYGLPLESQNINEGRTAVTLALGCVLPTYLSSYFIFAALIFMIRRHLRSFAVKFSSTTLELERKFYRVMLLQSILPVVIISIPIGIFIIPAVIAASLGPLTLAMTFSVWLVPVGTVFILFVRGPSKNATIRLKTKMQLPAPNMIVSETNSSKSS